MIAISLRFLAGRFHATPWGHHVNEGVVEWPPSPWRLLRSLVAVFHRARPAHVTEAQLERIVTALSKELPVFSLPAVTTAHTRHYDQDNGGVKFFDTFVAVAKSAPVICCWPAIPGLDYFFICIRLQAIKRFLVHGCLWKNRQNIEILRLPPPRWKFQRIFKAR